MDGSTIWIQLNTHAMAGPQGTMYYEGFVYDVTQRKAAEGTLEEPEEMLRKQSAAIASSMDGIGILDEGLQLTYLNDALARHYGMQPYSSLGHPLRALYYTHENARLQTHILPTVAMRARQ